MNINIIEYNSYLIHKLELDKIMARDKLAKIIINDSIKNNIEIKELILLYDEVEEGAIGDQFVCEALNIINNRYNPYMWSKITDDFEEHIDLLNCLIDGEFYSIMFSPIPLNKEELGILIRPNSKYYEIEYYMDNERFYITIFDYKLGGLIPTTICDKYRNIYLNNLNNQTEGSLNNEN